MPIDLSVLPAPKVIEEIDYEAIFLVRKQRLIAAMPENIRDAVAATLALETEPMTILLQENAYNEMILRQRINNAAKAVLLAFAKGSDLEQVAARFDKQRLTVTPANLDSTPPTEAVMEDDDSLLERAQLSFEGLSVAGPEEAYKLHAKSADGRVADISVESPAGAEIVITVLSHEGDGSAADDLLKIVDTALSSKLIRPIGDRVTVQSASIINYAISAVLHLPKGAEAEPILAAANLAIEAYRTAKRRLGRGIFHSALDAALHVSGVEKVDLTDPPADLSLKPNQAANCTGYTITAKVSDD